jgi:DNA-directed RNA polymerase specialized sigma24 family protein
LRRPTVAAAAGGSPPEPSDLLLDLEDVLRRFPPVDAAVCRMRLVEGRTFQEIGAALGIDASTACRRFDRRVGAIRHALRDYMDDAPVILPIAGPAGAWASAA